MTQAATQAALVSALRRIAGDLDAIGAQWAVVGGLAVAARTGAGAIDDLDLAVGVTDDRTAEAVVKNLQERGYSAVTAIEHEDVDRLASVRVELLRDNDGMDPVQLLFASSGIEVEVTEGAEPLDVLGVRAPVARLGHLLALKVLSHEVSRPQDGEDIAALLKATNETDLQEAEDAFVLIAERGFDRGRNLAEEYERFLAREPAAGG